MSGDIIETWSSIFMKLLNEKKPNARVLWKLQGSPNWAWKVEAIQNKDMYVTNDTALQEQRAGSSIPICTTFSGILSYGYDLV